MRGYPALAFSIVLAGCVEEPSPPDVVARHGSIVRVETSEPPTLIAYREEGSATWQTPTAKTSTRFELAVTGPYRVAVVCDEPDSGTLWVRQLARTPDDGRRVEVDCDTQPAPYRVTGSMVQAGNIFMGDSVARARPPSGSFELGAERGKHALIASSDDRIAIRRHVKTTADVALSPIDLDVEGAALVPVTFQPANLYGDETEITTIVFLTVDDTTALLDVDAGVDVSIAPRSVLKRRDEQAVTIAVHNPQVGRTLTRPYREGDSPVLPLPLDALGPLTWNDLEVTWSTLPAYDRMELSFDAFSFDAGVLIAHRIDATPRFVAATGTTSLEIDTTAIPGFDPAWSIDPALDYHRYFGVEKTLANGDVVGSDVSQDVTAP